MKLTPELKTFLAELAGGDLLLLDGCDEAFLGLDTDNRAVYGYAALVELFRTRDGMTEEESMEYIDYNIVRALPYYPHGPIVMYMAEEFEGFL